MAIVFLKSDTPIKVGSLFINKNDPFIPVSTSSDIEIPGVNGDIYLADVVCQLSDDDMDILDIHQLVCVNAREIDSDYYHDVQRISAFKNISGPNIDKIIEQPLRVYEGFNVEPCNGFRSLFPTVLSHCSDVHKTEFEAWEWILTVLKNQPIASKWGIKNPEACAKCLGTTLFGKPLNSNSEITSGWLHFEEGTNMEDILDWLKSQFNLKIERNSNAKAS